MATRDPRTGRDPVEAHRPVETRRPAGTAAPPRGSWRDEVIGASGLNVLAGLWLIISPWVVGYEDADAWWNPIVFGSIITVLGLVRITAAIEQSWISVVNMLIGAWLFSSAFWLSESSEAQWNVGVLGVIVFALGAWSAAASGGDRTRSRTERSRTGRI